MSDIRFVLDALIEEGWKVISSPLDNPQGYYYIMKKGDQEKILHLNDFGSATQTNLSEICAKSE